MRTFMNIDTGELWTEDEIRRAYADFQTEIVGEDEDDGNEYPTFASYLEHLLSMGQQRTGGIAEVTGYVVRDREAGNVVERFDSLEEAETALRGYEESDKSEGIYEADFYEVAPSID